jgi:hypothetical protein
MMALVSILILMYWLVHTVKVGLSERYKEKLRETNYEAKLADRAKYEQRASKAEKTQRFLVKFKKLLKAIRGIETAILIANVIALAVILVLIAAGAIMAGGIVAFGYLV